MNIPDQFRVVENGLPGDKLITPSFACNNSTWKDWSLRWLRSLHIDENNRIVSLGFCKFLNIEEGSNEYQVTQKDLLNAVGSDMYATLKIDGSMLCRYVRDGEVCWRTRGSLQVGLDNKFELQQFFHDYPKLVDPTFYSDVSLLFEWVSPENRIVLAYPEPDLYLVGGVRYDRNVPWWDASPALFTMPQLVEVSEDCGVQLPQWYKLNNVAEITKLINDLQTDNEIEGFVIRFANCQRMVKLKTEHYFTLHALRSLLTTAKLVDLWLQWGRPNFAQYTEQFVKAHDYDSWQWALPAVSAMYDGVKVALNIFDHLTQFVADLKHLTRKDFALLAQQKYDGLKLATCFNLLDGRKESDDFWKKMILQNCKQCEMRMFKEDTVETNT